MSILSKMGWPSATPNSMLHILSLALSVLLSLFLMPQAALAQGKTVTLKDLEVTKEQMAHMRQLFANVDAKMLATVKGEEALTKAMQNELKSIGAIKGAAEKRKAIAAYQSKYAKSYEIILKKSGVDLTDLAAKLNEITGLLRFRAQRNFTLTASLRQTHGNPPPPSPASAEPVTTEIRSSAYTDHKVLSCGLVGGSDVTFTGTRITNSTFAAEAGGCLNDGDKTTTITFPAGAHSARIDTEADLTAECFAVGLLGVAGSNARSSLYIGVGQIDDAFHEFVLNAAVAPFLWVASTEEESIEPARIGRDLEPGKTYTIGAITQTSAIATGVVAGTSATAKVRHLEASLTVEQ